MNHRLAVVVLVLAGAACGYARPRWGDAPRDAHSDRAWEVTISGRTPSASPVPATEGPLGNAWAGTGSSFRDPSGWTASSSSHVDQYGARGGKWNSRDDQSGSSSGRWGGRDSHFGSGKGMWAESNPHNDQQGSQWNPRDDQQGSQWNSRDNQQGSQWNSRDNQWNSRDNQQGSHWSSRDNQQGSQWSPRGNQHGSQWSPRNSHGGGSTGQWTDESSNARRSSLWSQRGASVDQDASANASGGSVLRSAVVAAGSPVVESWLSGSSGSAGSAPKQSSAAHQGAVSTHHQDDDDDDVVESLHGHQDRSSSVQRPTGWSNAQAHRDAVAAHTAQPVLRPMEHPVVLPVVQPVAQPSKAQSRSAARRQPELPEDDDHHHLPAVQQYFGRRQL